MVVSCDYIIHGSVTVTPSLVTMENAMFRRQKRGLSLTKSILNSDGSNLRGGTNTARCLFGPPDPKECKDLVREFELNNAINFGKRFNFDIINGEPFPSAKKMKMSHDQCEDSDEENSMLKRITDKQEVDKSEGYIWGEVYSQDYMAMCNKHAVNASMEGQAKVSLLFAPITPNHSFTSSRKSAISYQKSPKITTSKSEPLFLSSDTSVTPSSPPDVISSSLETNNNVKSCNRSHSTTSATEKKRNRVNSHSHPHSHHQPSAKKSSPAQHILALFYH